MFSNLDLNETHQELFDDSNTVQKMVHKNYKNQKINSLDQGVSVVSGWFNKDIKVKYSDAVEIGKFQGTTMYGKIAPRFQTPTTQSALEKGFAVRSKGAEGIKLLDGKFLSLKILGEAGDNRLYTSTIHKNDIGDLLAIFDHSTNHACLQKKINSVKCLDILEDCMSQLVFEDSNSTQDCLDVCGAEANYHDLS